MTLGNCASATTMYEYANRTSKLRQTMQHETATKHLIEHGYRLITTVRFHCKLSLALVLQSIDVIVIVSRARKKLHTQAHCTETRGTQPQNGKALCSLVVEYFYSSSSCCFLVSASVLPTIPPITQCCQHGRPRHHTLLQSTALGGFRKRCTMCQERAMSKASTSLTYMPRPVPRC